MAFNSWVKGCTRNDQKLKLFQTLFNMPRLTQSSTPSANLIITLSVDWQTFSKHKQNCKTGKIALEKRYLTHNIQNYINHVPSFLFSQYAESAHLLGYGRARRPSLGKGNTPRLFGGIFLTYVLERGLRSEDLCR